MFSVSPEQMSFISKEIVVPDHACGSREPRILKQKKSGLSEQGEKKNKIFFLCNETSRRDLKKGKRTAIIAI